jgi:D-alanyl-D-alanine dipeptidase
MKNRIGCFFGRLTVVFFVLCASSSTGICQTPVLEIAPKPPDAPEQWKNLIGVYASLQDTLCVAEKDTQLFVVTKKLQYVKLRQDAHNSYGFNEERLFDDTALVFRRDGNGRPQSMTIGGVSFRRLILGNENGSSFRINPLKPADELRKIALAATPPKEEGNFLKPDLVDLSTLDKSIKFDVRYATTNNFVGEKFYTQARAFLQRPAAEALLQSHRWLRQFGFGLLIHDAYRPWYVTRMFWDATPDDKKIFVADPSQGSRHNRGCAVDLTLYDLNTGNQVEMTGGYDEMSERSYPGFPGGTSLERWHRDLLGQAMSMRGYTVYQFEWWHFDYKDWKQYPIGTKTFEELNQ